MNYYELFDNVLIIWIYSHDDFLFIVRLNSTRKGLYQVKTILQRSVSSSFPFSLSHAIITHLPEGDVVLSETVIIESSFLHEVEYCYEYNILSQLQNVSVSKLYVNSKLYHNHNLFISYIDFYFTSSIYSNTNQFNRTNRVYA